jgi:hypothetical protein
MRKTVKRPTVVKRKRKVRKAMTNSDEKKPAETPKPTEVLADEKKPTEAPPEVEQFSHKNPPIGPKTGKPLADWNQFRDYEQFNPTAEK